MGVVLFGTALFFCYLCSPTTLKQINETTPDSVQIDTDIIEDAIVVRTQESLPFTP